MNEPNTDTQFDSLTGEKLWREVGKDFDNGIQKFAAENNADSDYVMALLIAESFNDSRVLISRGWFRSLPSRLYEFGNQKLKDFRFWDIFLWTHKIGIALFIALLLGVSYLVFQSWQRVEQDTAEQMVVNRENGLPVYYKISKEDLVSAKKKKVPGSFTDPTELVGRYTLAQVSRGAVLTEDKLLDHEFTAEMANRDILAIPVKKDAVSNSLKPITKIELVFSKKQAELKEASAQPEQQSTILEDVLLLAIEKRENTDLLTVALSREKIESIKSLLGNSEIFVLQNLP